MSILRNPFVDGVLGFMEKGPLDTLEKFLVPQALQKFQKVVLTSKAHNLRRALVM